MDEIWDLLNHQYLIQSKVMVKQILFIIISFILTVFLYGENINFTELRKQMVEEQLFNQGIIQEEILDAFFKVKRHRFVKAELRKKAYSDSPLVIDDDQVIFRPFIVAIMTYAVDLNKDKKVLEIGTGSGYHSAILAELAKTVFTIERVESISIQAKKRLDSLGYKNIKYKIGDGYEGWEKFAPYDAIIVTCSEDHIPKPLIQQLAINGRMIIPVRYAQNLQELILLQKNENGQLKKTNLVPVQIVPLIRGSRKK